MQSQTSNNIGKVIPAAFRIFLVRHGETSGNKEMKIQGQIDIPLNETGERQAVEAGISLKNINFHRAYASDLSRAFKTCELILSQNGCQTPLISKNTKLRERNFGAFEGKLWEDCRLAALAAGSKWPDYIPEGAETRGEVGNRMVAFFKELCQSIYDKSTVDGIDKENNGECILVVSHGAALRELFIHFHSNLGCTLNEDQKDKLNKICPNTSVSEFSIRYAPKNYDVKCLQFHQSDHLENVPTDL